MAKTKKSGKRKGPTPKRAGSRGAAVGGQHLGLDVVGGSATDRAWRYLEKFMKFETWILDGRPEDADLSDVPEEHHALLERWPDGFELFRHAMWSYAERAVGMNRWTSTIRSLMVRARSADPKGFEQFQQDVATVLPRFMVQRNNVLHQVRDDVSGSARERHRAMLKLYADMYEIDFPLWVLGVIGRAHRTGKVDSGAFGGPQTKVAQGSLVDAVSAAIDGTPLAPLLASAYIPNLRNTIGHNSYDLRLGGSDGTAFVSVRDTAAGENWNADVVHAAWQSTSDLINAAMSACASIDCVIAPSGTKTMADYGVLSITYAVNHGEPLAVVAQLWCFRDIDPDGLWLDEATFSVQVETDGRERAGFTDQAFMVGTPFSDGLVGRALVERGWIRVIRIPIAPHMDMGFPLFKHANGAEYEVVGVGDEHDVPFLRTVALSSRPSAAAPPAP